MNELKFQSLFTQHRGMTLAWLALIATTCIAWSLSGSGDSGSIAMNGVVISAFIKTWVIGFQFMELKHSPRWLRHGFDAWSIAMCAVLIGILQQLCLKATQSRVYMGSYSYLAILYLAVIRCGLSYAVYELA